MMRPRSFLLIFCGWPHGLSKKIIGFAVGFYQAQLSILPRLGCAVFHAQHAFVTFVVNVLKDIPVVHLAGARLVTTWIIPDLEIGDLAIAKIHVMDQVAFVPLDMVHVEEDLAGWTVHRSADGEGLVRMAEEQIRRVAERFQHHDNAMRLEYFSASAQSVYDICRLNVHRQVSFEVAGYDGGELAIAAFGYLDGLTAAFQEDLEVLRFARGRAVGPVAALVQHKDAHVHAQPGHGVADLLLLLFRPLCHAVVFHRPETMVISELELVDEIIPGTVAEHAVVYAIVEMEGLVGMTLKLVGIAARQVLIVGRQACIVSQSSGQRFVAGRALSGIQSGSTQQRARGQKRTLYEFFSLHGW